MEKEEIKPSCGINHRWEVMVDYPAELNRDETDPDFIGWDYPVHIYLYCLECGKKIDIETFSEF